MTEADYIAGVCERNPLSARVERLFQSGEVCQCTEVSVDLPSVGPPARSIAACAAGLALLSRWAGELEEVHRAREIYSDGPVLVIDQEWLDQTADAAPPRVVLFLAKQGEDWPVISEGGRRHEVEARNSPLSELLVSASFQEIKVARIESTPESGRYGFWLFGFGRLPNLLRMKTADELGERARAPLADPTMNFLALYRYRDFDMLALRMGNAETMAALLAAVTRLGAGEVEMVDVSGLRFLERREDGDLGKNVSLKFIDERSGASSRRGNEFIWAQSGEMWRLLAAEELTILMRPDGGGHYEYDMLDGGGRVVFELSYMEY